jgi:hypothetical protein
MLYILMCGWQNDSGRHCFLIPGHNKTKIRAADLALIEIVSHRLNRYR